jgi:hypothetical protein
MAIGRLSVVVGKKGKASPHAQYIAREGKYAKHNSDLEKLEQTGSGNMPQWAKHDPNFFWKMSDDKERKNGTSYREHVIALPRELNPIFRNLLVRKWIEQEIGDKHAYQFAIHNPIAADGKEQPHAHIMFSERLRDGIERDPDSYFKRYNSKNPERGGAKKANTPMLAAERKQELKAMRDRWEQLCNTYLKVAKSDARISMKSLKDRGIEREPVNFSMSQIKNPSIKKIYIEQLAATSEFKQAMKERDTINVVDELAAIKIDEKYYEQANRAITSSKQRIDSTKQAVTATADSFKIANSRTKKTADAACTIARRTENSKQAIASSKQLAAVADRAITSSKRAAAKRLEQQQQALERTPFDLVNIRMRSKVVNKSYNKVDRNLSGDVPIGSVIRDIIEAAKAGHSATLQEGNNDHLAGNDTAQRIKAFMLKKITSYDAVYDYCNLSVKDFTDKHNLKCDLNDLQRLNDIHPAEPVVEPSKQAQTNTALNLEQKPRVDNSYDNSPNF